MGCTQTKQSNTVKHNESKYNEKKERHQSKESTLIYFEKLKISNSKSSQEQKQQNFKEFGISLSPNKRKNSNSATYYSPSREESNQMKMSRSTLARLHQIQEGQINSIYQYLQAQSLLKTSINNLNSINMGEDDTNNSTENKNKNVIKSADSEYILEIEKECDFLDQQTIEEETNKSYPQLPVRPAILLKNSSNFNQINNNNKIQIKN